MPHSHRPFKIGCAERSLALHSMHESAFRSARDLRALLCLCALGCCSVRFLFWRRPILSVVRRLLRLPRLLRLLSELLQLRVGRLLSALVAASLLRRILWRVGRTRMGRWLAWRTRRLAWRRTRLAWRRRARSPLTRRSSEYATSGCVTRAHSRLPNRSEHRLRRSWLNGCSPPIRANSRSSGLNLAKIASASGTRGELSFPRERRLNTYRQSSIFLKNTAYLPPKRTWAYAPAPRETQIFGMQQTKDHHDAQHADCRSEQAA